MRNLLEIMILSVIWCGFSNDFTVLNIIMALFISTAIVLLVNKNVNSDIGVNPLAVIVLLFVVFVELIKASIMVALETLGFTKLRNPKIIMIPLACENDVQKTILAILVSLTPGTLSIDLNEPKTHLILHVMFSNDAEVVLSLIKNQLEKRVMRAFYVR